MHTSVQTEQRTQTDEPHSPEEDSDPQAAQDDLNITEPPGTNSETAAGTAYYPTRTHHPRVFLYHLLVHFKVGDVMYLVICAYLW